MSTHKHNLKHKYASLLSKMLRIVYINDSVLPYKSAFLSLDDIALKKFFKALVYS